ncbi:MAG TPA: hypothetical protein VE870_10020, partial [Bacteroidales bacterium]|nr:hypothetical protein [Bacteroidales bacterium]
YNGILVNAPPPFTLSGNRYYTLGFIQMAKEHLDPTGIFSLSLPTGYNYSNESARQLNSVIFNTLKKVFTHVLIVQGQENYFLASDMVLSADIPGLIKKRGLITTYVNPYYLNGDDLKMRSEMTRSDLDLQAGFNTVQKPKAFFLALSYWASMYGRGMKAVMYGILIVFFLFIAFYFRSPVVMNMYLAGFSSAGLEILLLFGLQSGLGNLYQYSALLLGVFMAGLAAGASFGNQEKDGHEKTRIIQAGLFLTLSTTGSVFILKLLSAPAGLILPAVLFLSLSGSAATGFIFSSSSHLISQSGQSRISHLYSADIFGGALGALAISVMLIPVAGFVWSSFILSAIMGISTLWLYLR